MQKWEYLSMPSPDNPGDLGRTKRDWLKMLGEQGWELIQAPQSGHSNTYYFKRPI